MASVEDSNRRVPAKVEGLVVHHKITSVEGLATLLKQQAAIQKLKERADKHAEDHVAQALGGMLGQCELCFEGPGSGCGSTPKSNS